MSQKSLIALISLIFAKEGHRLALNSFILGILGFPLISRRELF